MHALEALYIILVMSRRQHAIILINSSIDIDIKPARIPYGSCFCSVFACLLCKHSVLAKPKNSPAPCHAVHAFGKRPD